MSRVSNVNGVFPSICEESLSTLAQANIFLFLVLQTFGKKIRAGGGKKIKNKIVNF